MAEDAPTDPGFNPEAARPSFFDRVKDTFRRNSHGVGTEQKNIQQVQEQNPFISKDAAEIRNAARMQTHETNVQNLMSQGMTREQAEMRTAREQMPKSINMAPVPTEQPAAVATPTVLEAHTDAQAQRIRDLMGQGLTEDQAQMRVSRETMPTAINMAPLPVEQAPSAPPVDTQAEELTEYRSANEQMPQQIIAPSAEAQQRDRLNTFKDQVKAEMQKAERQGQPITQELAQQRVASANLTAERNQQNPPVGVASLPVAVEAPAVAPQTEIIVFPKTSEVKLSKVKVEDRPGDEALERLNRRYPDRYIGIQRKEDGGIENTYNLQLADRAQEQDKQKVNVDGKDIVIQRQFVIGNLEGSGYRYIQNESGTWYRARVKESNQSEYQQVTSEGELQNLNKFLEPYLPTPTDNVAAAA